MELLATVWINRQANETENTDWVSSAAVDKLHVRSIWKTQRHIVWLFTDRFPVKDFFYLTVDVLTSNWFHE